MLWSFNFVWSDQMLQKLSSFHHILWGFNNLQLAKKMPFEIKYKCEALHFKFFHKKAQIKSHQDKNYTVGENPMIAARDSILLLG